MIWHNYVSKHRNQYVYIIILFLLLFIFPATSNCQSIDFKLTDCLAYIDGEIDLNHTREMRKNCSDGEVVLAFYPDTEIIELQIYAEKISSKYELLKMEPAGNNTYKAITPDSAPVEINLELNKLFGYIRGGEIKIAGFGVKEGIGEVQMKFERK